MIQKLRIKAFKSLEDVEVELGSINIFIGANGSGKSNLLEAIGVLGAAAGGRVDEESLLYRGVRPSVPSLYKSSFRNTKKRNAIRFDGVSEGASYAVELHQPQDQFPEPQDQFPVWRFKTEKLTRGEEKIFGRSPATAYSTQLNPEAGLAALKLVEMPATSPEAQLLTVLKQYAIFTPSTPILRGLVPDSQSRAPVGLSGGRLAEALADLDRLRASNESYQDLRESLVELIDWAEDYRVRATNEVPLAPTTVSARRVLTFQDRFMARNRRELTAYDASEGALYVLFLTVLAAHPQAPPLLAIDNVDQALNPRLARAVMGRISEWALEDGGNRQLLLTSHNPLLLDGLPLQNDRIRLFTVARSNKGRTVVHRVEVDERLLERAREGWPLSRLWVQGHLGGVPDV